MEFEIEFTGQVFICTASGNAQVEAFNDLLKALFTHDKWKPETPYLVDYSKLNARKLTVNSIKQIAFMSSTQRALHKISKTAVVAPNDLEFGFSRMWQAFMSSQDNDCTKIFRNRQDALKWIST